ncbi:hypothetical protein, partial [Klebsiella pneumoniae]|uniref:hypothetical protein n=1 Tax=Klebsiella pneumoniae TaxID=573 RepID=UPI0027310B34
GHQNDPLASMRPRLIAGEDKTAWTRVGTLIEASMRPRLIAGEDMGHAGSKRESSSGASMRPRLIAGEDQHQHDEADDVAEALQ